MTTCSRLPPSPMEASRLRSLLAKGDAVAIVDVRSSEEFAAEHLPGAVNIPLNELGTRAKEIPVHATVVTVCSFGGSRAFQAAEMLRTAGCESASPLLGGIDAWSSTAPLASEGQP